MVEKKWIKHIKSLHQKKFRQLHKQFFVEGIKVVSEFIKEGHEPIIILASEDHSREMMDFSISEVSTQIFNSLSALQNPNGILAVFDQPSLPPVPSNGWIVALNRIQDPGNLGTIIRLCDWFGIGEIWCDKGTVDGFNPKVLQATAGSAARVRLRYDDLTDLIGQSSLPVYGTYMEGTSIYQTEFPENGILIMGNEGQGIDRLLANQVTHKIGIPQYGNKNTESLNVAMATGLILGEIRRKG